MKGIRLTKTDEQFGSVLDGAKFKLYCTNAGVTATKPQSGLYNWTDSATLTISGAPAGSQLVDKDGNAIQGSGLTADSESGMVYYKIANNPNVKLPNACGPGTTWLYLIGLILFVGSGILLVARRRMNHQGLSSK